MYKNRILSTILKASIFLVVFPVVASFSGGPARELELSKKRPGGWQTIAQSETGASSGWRFVRTPEPGGGKAAVGMMRTIDPRRSDPDIAGLWLRCSEKTDQLFEVLIVVVTPMPPRAKPAASVGSVHLEASVVPPGTAILLPKSALALARGPWQTMNELPIRIEHDGRAMAAVIPLAGFPAALDRLAANCSSR